MLSWISENTLALGTIIAFVAALIPSIQYVITKRSEDRKHTFEAYHRMIGDLVDPPTPRLDRQIAVVYELRNFKGYYPVTYRILEGVKAVWNNPPGKVHPRIFEEIELTQKYIKKRMK